MSDVDLDEYVCPRCGTSARGVSVCASCGTNLDALDELPRRSEFAAGGIAAVERQHTEQVSAYVGAPGGVVRRWAAMMIDNVLGVVFAIVVALAVALTFDTDGSAAAGGALLVWFVLYPPSMLAFSNGQTLGKRAMAVRVENQTGEAIGFGRAFLRESLLKLTLWVIPLGLIASAIVARSNERRISLHDRITATQVVTTG